MCILCAVHHTLVSDFIPSSLFLFIPFPYFTLYLFPYWATSLFSVSVCLKALLIAPPKNFTILAGGTDEWLMWSLLKGMQYLDNKTKILGGEEIVYAFLFLLT